MISCLWLPTPYPSAVRRLILQENADLPDGRCTLYVCAECGDIGCGAVTVRITADEAAVVWSDFVYQNNYDDEMTFPLGVFNALGPLRFEKQAYEAHLRALLEK